MDETEQHLHDWEGIRELYGGHAHKTELQEMRLQLGELITAFGAMVRRIDALEERIDAERGEIPPRREEGSAPNLRDEYGRFLPKS